MIPHLTPVRSAIIKKKEKKTKTETKSKPRETVLVRMGRNCKPCTPWTGMQNGGNIGMGETMENNMEVPQKLKIELPYDAAISPLNMYPKELKLGSQRY